MTLQAMPFNLDEYAFTQECQLGCGSPATHVAKGCMDKEAVLLCQECLTRGLDLVRKAVRMYQRHNKHVMICGDCNRPILNLGTHVDIRSL